MKCCDITAGMLREPVTVQRQVSVSDGMGGQAIQWIDLYTTRADVRPISGREAVQAMQLQASVTHRVYMRYRADITAADRLMIRGNPLQVRAIINVELRNRWLELSCDAGVAT